jgi:hypothetical protein
LGLAVEQAILEKAEEIFGNEKCNERSNNDRYDGFDNP